MEIEINIPEINAIMNIYGSIVATPNIREDIKNHCNDKIQILLNLIDPVVDQLRKENSVIAQLSL